MRIPLWIVVLGFVPALACSQAPKAAPKPGAPKPSAAAKPGPAPKPAVGNGSAAAAVPVSTVIVPENYAYAADGRRDPFMTLIAAPVAANRAVKAVAAPAKRGEGLDGLGINEMVVEGIIESEGKTIALVHGADRRRYKVHAGDKLMDGTVKAIDLEGLVISQVVKEPSGATRHRDVRKLLRPEDVK